MNSKPFAPIVQTSVLKLSPTDIQSPYAFNMLQSGVAFSTEKGRVEKVGNGEYIVTRQNGHQIKFNARQLDNPERVALHALATL